MLCLLHYYRGIDFASEGQKVINIFLDLKLSNLAHCLLVIFNKKIVKILFISSGDYWITQTEIYLTDEIVIIKRIFSVDYFVHNYYLH